MENIEISVLSSSRFLSRYLVVEPSLIGAEHHFTFNNHEVRILLPKKDMVGDRDSNAKAHIGARSAKNNEPLDYDIQMVDVELTLVEKLTLPGEVLNRPIKAYELFSEKERQRLDGISDQQHLLAEKAFEYWLRVVRWISDDFRIGSPNVEGFQSGWATYLLDVKSHKKIWGQAQVFYMPGYKMLTVEKWQEIQEKIDVNSQPPIYIELLHDGEGNLALGDYKYAIINLAMSCEIFIKQMVNSALPNNLTLKIRKYIEDAPLYLYRDEFIEPFLDHGSKEKYQALKPELLNLFKDRNTLVHSGKCDRLNEQRCRSYLRISRDLLSLTLNNNSI